MPSPDDQPRADPPPSGQSPAYADRGARWTVPLAAAVTLCILRRRLHTLFDGTTELRHFFDRAIGITTLEGVDASGYAHNFVVLQLLLAATFLTTFALLRVLRRRLDRWCGTQAPEHLWIARLAEMWTALAFFDLFFRSRSLLALSVLLAHLVAFGFAILVVRTWLHRRSAARAHPILSADRHFVEASLLWPASFLLAGWTVLSVITGSQALRVPSTTLGFLVYATVWLVLLWASARLTRAAQRRRLMAAAAPWMLVPAAVALGNELHALHRTVAPQTWALVSIAVLAASSVATWFLLPGRLARLGRDLPAAKTLLHAVYFPLAVVSLALLRLYQARRGFGSLDYFHLGETTVPAHQLFRFSALPLIDIRPAHTLSDLFWQGLYLLVHGYERSAPLDMTLWSSFLPEVATLLLAYYVLSRVLSPGYAFLATCILPVLMVLPTYYAAVLIPALFLARALERPTLLRFLTLWISLALLALWRIDFGLLGGVATIGVLAPYLLDVRSLSQGRRRGRHRLRAAGRSLGWVAAGGLAGLLAMLAWRGPAALDRLAFLLDSYSYRLITRTRSEVIHDFDLVAVIQYYLLPWVALGFVLFYAVRRLMQRRFVPSHQSMLAFLATFSLVISVRSMERHSLIELFNPYLAVFLLAVLPVLAGGLGVPRERQTTRAVFAAVLVLYSLAALPPSEERRASPSKSAALLGPSVVSFQSLGPDQARVRFNDAKHRLLVEFLGGRLEGDETFYDFTNSPLLYVLTDRQFPTYVIPNLIQTSETVQADVLRQLDELRTAERLPLVVFEQGNPFWDNTDGVANEVRCYRVAEWIYHHYRPAVQVGPYQVWQEKRLPPLEADAGVSVYELAYRERPVLWNLRHDAEGETHRFEPLGDDPNVIRLFDLSDLPDLDAGSSWHLELDASWVGDQPLQLFFGYDGRHFQASDTAWIRAEDGAGGATARIQPPSGARRLTDVRIDVPEGSILHLGASRIRVGSSVAPLTAGDLRQSFELRQLPAVWARLDPLRARSQTKVLATLLEQPARLGAGREVALRVPKPSSASTSASAYLHLQIVPVAPQADEPTVVEVRYGPERGDAEDGEAGDDRDGRDAGPPAFSFELVPSFGKTTPLRRNESEQLSDLEAFPQLPRWVYRAAGPAPEILQPFQLDGVPALGPDEELRLRLRYRSRAAGRMSVCVDCDSLPADGDRSASAPFVRTPDSGDPARLELLLDLPRGHDSAGHRPRLRLALGFAGGRRADAGRRTEPPMFEIVEAELLRASTASADYLIRLSTQWRWASGDVETLLLRSDRSVIVEGAWLRAGD